MSVKRSVRSITTALITSATFAAAPLGLVTIASTAGCGIFGSSGPSDVGQGKQYTSGDPNFDQFFTELFELQVMLGDAPEGEKDVRRKLAATWDVEEDASAILIAKAVKRKVDAWAATGIGLKAETSGLEGSDPGDSKLAVTVTDGSLSGDDQKMVKAAEAAGTSAAKVVARMGQAKMRITKLQATISALEGAVDTAFKKGGPGKKSEVRKNLEDAKTLMPLMNTRAEEVAISAKKLAKKLGEALTTDPSLLKKPEPKPVPPPETDGEGGPTGDGENAGDKPKPSGDKPKPSGDKPKPKPGGDKPKPSGGTPPPDFEP